MLTVLLNVVLFVLCFGMSLLLIMSLAYLLFSPKDEKNSKDYAKSLQDLLDRRISELNSLRVANKHLYALLQSCYEIASLSDESLSKTIEDYDSIPAQLKECYFRLDNEIEYSEKENTSIKIALIEIFKELNISCTSDYVSESFITDKNKAFLVRTVECDSEYAVGLIG